LNSLYHITTLEPLWFVRPNPSQILPASTQSLIQGKISSSFRLQPSQIKDKEILRLNHNKLVGRILWNNCQINILIFCVEPLFSNPSPPHIWKKISSYGQKPRISWIRSIHIIYVSRPHKTIRWSWTRWNWYRPDFLFY
jgi:hypothetical protein